jgi:hypothetical protein
MMSSVFRDIPPYSLVKIYHQGRRVGQGTSIVMHEGITEGLDTPELRNAQSVYCNEETGKTQLAWSEASCCCQC